MAKKGNVFVDLFKNALGLPTSDSCCSVPVAPAQSSECCSGAKETEGSQTAKTKA